MPSGHIIMEDLHKQRKQANALLTHFIGPAVELLPEFLEESRRVGFFTTAVISAQLTFFPAPTQDRAGQLHSQLQFSTQPLQQQGSSRVLRKRINRSIFRRENISG